MTVRFRNRDRRKLTEPRAVAWLLSDPRAAWLWLLPRLWVGWTWIHAGEHKLTSPDWVKTGAALQGFWQQAVAIPDTGRPAITFGWYRAFLQFLLDAHAYVWFAKLVTMGELLVGVALILGAFTGIAAFAGGFMNWNFMMAGSASSNPMLFVLSIGFILAWKVAGLVGLDYFLLPWLGTPWEERDPCEEARAAEHALAEA
jgi:thiosulfate dehydrogenase [quinone] large subunit